LLLIYRVTVTAAWYHIVSGIVFDRLGLLRCLLRCCDICYNYRENHYSCSYKTSSIDRQ